MRFLYLDLKMTAHLNISVGYNFFWGGGNNFIVSNHRIYFSDYQQEQQNVAAHKLSGPNNFTGLEDVYWNV
jgi:hypothetical protein